MLGSQGQPTLSSAQSSGTGTHTATSEFVPTKVFVRGWAPFGSSRTDMLGRQEYTNQAKEIIAKLPARYQSNITADNPGPYNFQITFKVKGGRLGCELIRDMLNSIFERDELKIKEAHVKASIECSPDRRAKYRIFNTNLEALKEQVNAEAYDVDERFLTIFNVEDASVVGEFRKGTSVWDWDDEVLKKMGVDKKTLLNKASA